MKAGDIVAHKFLSKRPMRVIESSLNRETHVQAIHCNNDGTRDRRHSRHSTTILVSQFEVIGSYTKEKNDDPKDQRMA